MALTLFPGPSGAGKTYTLLSRLIRESVERPDENFLLLVPEQYSMAAQASLVRMHPRHGILNIDVLSFQRLAFRILEETGGQILELLDDTGKQFVLRRLALTEGKQLEVLSGALSKNGAIADLKSVFSELMQYHVSADDLLAAAEKCTGPLRLKLRDIAGLKKQYEKYCENNLQNAEEVPVLLGGAVPRSKYLRNCTVALDGYTGFTPSQLVLIRSLLMHARNVYVTVTCEADTDFFSPIPENDLFRPGREMIRSLLYAAEDVRVPLCSPVRVFPHEKSRASGSPALRHLERSLFRQHPSVYKGDASAVSVTSFADPASEIRGIARSIRRLVRAEGLRYRDIALLSGDPVSYGDLVRRIFTEEGIPFFVDEKRSILGEPLIEFVRALLALMDDGWTGEIITRLLRTGYLPVAEDLVYRLENYILALGLRGKRAFHEPFLLIYPGEDPAEVPALNAARRAILSVLDPFEEAFRTPHATVRMRVRALYDLISALELQQKTADRAAQLKSAGDVTGAAELLRLYPVLIDILDRLVGVLGDTSLSISDFTSLLETAFSETRFGLIPPGNDAVMVCDMERSRLSSVDVLFFAGCNEGLLPKAVPPGGLLTEADREVLLRAGIRLAPSAREELIRSRYYLYLALTRPEKQLRLTFTRMGGDAQEMRPSYILGLIRRILPRLSETVETDVSLSGTETYADGLRYLAGRIRTITEETAPAFRALAASLSEDPGSRAGVAKILGAARLSRPPESIGEENARALYGATLTGSATRLEQYAKCPFSYFAAFGLKLSERYEFSPSGLDRGNILHTALENFSRALPDEGLRWQDLSDGDLASRVRSAVEDAAAVYGNRLFMSSARSQYEIGRLARMAERSVWAMREQLRAGAFDTAAYEKAFRENGNGISDILMPDGTSLRLTGRIDRLDLSFSEKAVYVKIMDYKTGNTVFDLSDAYYGLALQLPLYMNAALREAGRMTGLIPVPAGMFYFRLRDPLLSFESGETKEERTRRLLREMRPSGLVSAEPDALLRLDRSLGTETSSDVIPFRRNKDGTPRADASWADASMFRALGERTERLVRRFAGGILSGDTGAVPYRKGFSSACDYCPFGSVCLYDRRIPGCRSRTLRPMKKEELWARITGEDPS